MELKIYKIKNKEGYFSTGSMHPRWTKKGKIWQSFGSVKSHLRQFCSSLDWNRETLEYSFKNNIPEDWIVLEITNNNVVEYYAKNLYPPPGKLINDSKIEVKLGNINSLKQLYEESKLIHNKIFNKCLNNYHFIVNKNNDLQKDLMPIVEEQIEMFTYFGLLKTPPPDKVSKLIIKQIWIDKIGNVEFL